MKRARLIYRVDVLIDLLEPSENTPHSQLDMKRVLADRLADAPKWLLGVQEVNLVLTSEETVDL